MNDHEDEVYKPYESMFDIKGIAETGDRRDDLWLAITMLIMGLIVILGGLLCFVQVGREALGKYLVAYMFVSLPTMFFTMVKHLVALKKLRRLERIHLGGK